MNKSEFIQRYGKIPLGHFGEYVRCLELRGRASDDDARIDAKAESECDMGVGCGTAGICYAEKMGHPEYCPKRQAL